MCCVDSENVAVVLARRESHPGVLRPRRRMRSAVHPNRAVPFRDLTPHPDRDEPLGVRVAFFPKSEIASPVQQKFRSVGRALLLPQCQARWVPGQRIDAAGIVDRHSGILHEHSGRCPRVGFLENSVIPRAGNVQAR